MRRDSVTSLLDLHLKTHPFHPFTIGLFDGRQFEVDHPTAVAGRSGLIVGRKPGGTLLFIDSESICWMQDDIVGGSPIEEKA